ncbi:hypothetical protein [Flavobacterium sp.]|uniref:hypothetical protein n=1 Tax=Flavobacterium sp. TaxID=239 RepID=UPI004033DD4D
MGFYRGNVYSVKTTETIQSVYRGDKRYELSDHLGNVHVVLTDRKELHCGLEDNVPFPEYYTAEVKNRYDYYPFGMLMEERKYSGPNCIYDRDSTLTMYSQDLSFDEDPMDWYYINEQDNPGIDGNGNMVLDRDQNTLLRLITPTEAGQQYRVRFGIDLNGCDSVLVAGNLQNATTQYINSSGDHTFYFTSNDDAYSSFGFYLDSPCQVLISYVIVEALDVSSTVVCDSNATLAYRYGFNGQMKVSASPY